MLRTPDKAVRGARHGAATRRDQGHRGLAAAARAAPPLPRTQVLQQLTPQAARADDEHADVVLQHLLHLLAWLEAGAHQVAGPQQQLVQVGRLHF
jgi:hypothetical protein